MEKEILETNAETMRHILTVRTLLMCAVNELIDRANNHDHTKLEDPEASIFAKYTKILAGLQYNSDEYKQALAEMKPALDHHYANGSHHPEYYPNGVEDMNLFDLIELLYDWKAATLRHKNGDIFKSLELNTGRFNIPPVLVKILANTLPFIEYHSRISNVTASYPHVE